MRTELTLIATLGSAALLLGAWTFQYFGYAPCQMCLWQRWPHAIAVLIGITALILPWRALLYLGALAALTTAAIGVFHTGVERDWWEGITSCAGAGDLTGLSVNDLLDPSRDVGPPLIKCDEVAWSLFGLSMASWNALISFALFGIWIRAARS